MGEAPAPGDLRPITVSIVSHGHDRYLPPLLAQIATTGTSVVEHVLLVHNLPPTALLSTGQQTWPFGLTETVNDRPAGFGANHNRSFARAVLRIFVC